MVHSVLKDSHLGHAYWAKTITTVYLLNCAPTKALDGITLEEAQTRVSPSVSHLHVFGCTIYMHITKQNRKEAWWEIHEMYSVRQIYLCFLSLMLKIDAEVQTSFVDVKQRCRSYECEDKICSLVLKLGVLVWY